MRKILLLLLLTASCANIIAQYKPPNAFDADLDIIRKRIIDDLLQPNVANALR